MKLEQSDDQPAINTVIEAIETSGLDPMVDVGELIHDIAGHYGAQAANSAASEDEADETIDAWSEVGSDVNNDGVHAQAAALVAFHGLDGALEVIAQMT